MAPIRLNMIVWSKATTCAFTVLASAPVRDARVIAKTLENTVRVMLRPSERQFRPACAARLSAPRSKLVSMLTESIRTFPRFKEVFELEGRDNSGYFWGEFGGFA